VGESDGLQPGSSVRQAHIPAPPVVDQGHGAPPTGCSAPGPGWCKSAPAPLILQLVEAVLATSGPVAITTAPWRPGRSRCWSRRTALLPQLDRLQGIGQTADSVVASGACPPSLPAPPAAPSRRRRTTIRCPTAHGSSGELHVGLDGRNSLGPRSPILLAYHSSLPSRRRSGASLEQIGLSELLQRFHHRRVAKGIVAAHQPRRCAVPAAL